MYQDLIKELKKVKKPEDINVTTADELINASVATLVSFHLQNHGAETPIESLPIARLEILHHIDNIMFEMKMEDVVERGLD